LSLRHLGVWSARKRRELAGILLHPDPPHIKRVYLGGFLLYALGLSVEEAADFIERYNCWVDFNRRITERNLRGIHKSTVHHRYFHSKCTFPYSSSSLLHCGRDARGGSTCTLTYPSSSPVLHKGGFVWIGYCAGNGYPLEWHRVYLLG